MVTLQESMDVSNSSESSGLRVTNEQIDFVNLIMIDHILFKTNAYISIKLGQKSCSSYRLP